MSPLSSPAAAPSNATSRRIVETAIAVFARHGFEAASTRALAEAAGVNQQAIQYHFGNKEGLYRASVSRIAERFAERMRPCRDRMESALREGLPDEARAALLATLDALAGLLLADSEHAADSDFVARAELENEAALDTLAAAMWESVTGPCARLLRRLRGDDRVEPATLAALALLGAITTFKKRCLRKTAMEALGWPGLGPREVAAIQNMVREQADAFLRRPRAMPAGDAA